MVGPAFGPTLRGLSMTRRGGKLAAEECAALTLLGVSCSKDSPG